MPLTSSRPHLLSSLDRDGFVVVDLLRESDLESLDVLLGSLPLEPEPGFTAVLGRFDLDRNHEISRSIIDCIGPRLDACIGAYVPIGSTFLIKGAGPEGGMDLHQDWSSVDESTDRSYNVWCPLVDVGPANGQLEVVPGSHRWFGAARSPFLPSVQVDLDDVPADLLHPLELRRGQAVIYDHALLHGSRPNRSGVARPVAQVGIRPASARLCMALPAGPGAELREVDEDAFFSGLAFERDGGDGGRWPLVAQAPEPPPTPADVLARCRPRVQEPARRRGWRRWLGRDHGADRID